MHVHFIMEIHIFTQFTATLRFHYEIFTIHSRKGMREAGVTSVRLCVICEYERLSLYSMKQDNWICINLVGAI